MGQARKRLIQLKRDHPHCCFCGGTRPTETADHQPAAIIFPDKQRPKGLEFPACERCNGQTKADEALLALVSRMSGSLRQNARFDPIRVSGLISTVEQAYPGLAARMLGPRLKRQQGDQVVIAGTFDVTDPQIDISFRTLAAKFALALFLHHTSAPAPIGTRIQTHWEHSHEGDVFGAVESFIALFPMHTDLRQGRWQTDESFFIRYAYGEGLLFTAAIFHESIALMARLVEPGAATAIDLDELVMGPSPKFGIAILDPIGVAKQILPVPHRQSLV